MYSSILSLGCATPENYATQEDLTKLGKEIFTLDDELSSWFEKVSQNSAINKRYSVCFSESIDRLRTLTEDSMEARNALYKKHAPQLALNAAKKAMQEWGGDPKEITHVVSVSCTGVMAPGIDVELIEGLGLRNDVERMGINFMGCFGAFKGLSCANAYALNDRRHRVLVVCTELCTLHAISSNKRETLLGNALFADGAAACIVGVGDGLWEIAKSGSEILPNSKDEMTWESGVKSLLMRMTLKVPIKIQQAIKLFSERLVETDTSLDQCSWAIHPGGKAILAGIEKACGLDKAQTKESWDVLRNYGNMSSPTFLFVLNELRKRDEKKPWTVGFGFGPGLSVEGILLKAS